MAICLGKRGDTTHSRCFARGMPNFSRKELGIGTLIANLGVAEDILDYMKGMLSNRSRVSSIPSSDKLYQLWHRHIRSITSTG